MLNRPQIHTLLILRNRGIKPKNPNDGTDYSIFSQLPVELIREISEFGQNPNSDFDKAIKHVARGELSDVKSILEEASSKEDKTKLKELLLSSGTAMTRCGLIVKHKTFLECAVGSGDPGMIEMIKSYFSKFEGGEEEKERQLERYRPCIEAMKDQKPDDLMWLLDVIKKSSLADVAAELAVSDQYDPSYKSPLRDAMNKFREEKLDPKVRVITKPRMHCNYQNLPHAYDMLDSNWDELKEWDDVKKEYNYDKCNLVARQVIGFIQLVELPAYERYLFARDQVRAAASGKKIEVERDVNYKHDYEHETSFPDFDESLIKSHSGFGFDCYSSIYGGLACGGRCCAVPAVPFTKLMSSKNVRLAELMPPHTKTVSCVIV